MRFRSLLQSILLIIPGLAWGCATDGSIADAFRQTAKAVTPKPVTDTPGDIKQGDDEWDDIGPEARKNQTIEHENDPLRDLLVSPRAQEIEKSLGVEN